MDKNPWICDEMMIRMIIWATQNEAVLLLDANCDQTNPNGTKSINSFQLLKSLIFFLQITFCL